MKLDFIIQPAINIIMMILIMHYAYTYDFRFFSMFAAEFEENFVNTFWLLWIFILFFVFQIGCIIYKIFYFNKIENNDKDFFLIQKIIFTGFMLDFFIFCGLFCQQLQLHYFYFLLFIVCIIIYIYRKNFINQISIVDYTMLSIKKIFSLNIYFLLLYIIEILIIGILYIYILNYYDIFEIFKIFEGGFLYLQSTFMGMIIIINIIIYSLIYLNLYFIQVNIFYEQNNLYSLDKS